MRGGSKMYVECKLNECTNLTNDDYDICHYHRSLLDRPCAHFYHNKENLGLAVQWCNKYDTAIYKIDCKGCEEQLDPASNTELIERLTGLNRG